MTQTMSSRSQPNMATDAVSLRRFPYPYKAALAICSDIDQTRTVDEFLAIQRFLCTTDETPMGQGVGLEIGNSFFFFDQRDDFSYFTHDDPRAKQVIVDMIHAGYLDCIHSFGDVASTREQCQQALDELVRQDCQLDVWVNHYGSPNNISQKFEYLLHTCQGDNPSSEVYHTDLTLQYGIRYAWVGANTRLIGQSAQPQRFPAMHLLDSHYPFTSTLDALRETRKQMLGARGDERFALHSSNELVQPLELADGQQVHEFIRFCIHPQGVSFGATSEGLAHSIADRVLRQLVSAQGFMIVYSHLGKNTGHEHVVAAPTQAALRNLAQYNQRGDIYVATTSRLLNYYNALEHIQWTHKQQDGVDRITITTINDPIFGSFVPTLKQLQGMTFYVPDGNRAEVWLDDQPVIGLQRNPADETGRQSITLPFVPLEFPF